MNAPIQHDTDRHCFTVALEGREAVLQYRLLAEAAPDNRVTGVNFTHTYVPPEFRGKGLAEALVREGLKWAKQQGYHIEANCWYVAKFLH